MNRQPQFYFFILTCAILATGCGNDEKHVAPVVTAPKKTVIMEPFKYHKLIEVSPGQDYDIVSWGRGSVKVGAFEILHSDSAAARYTTTTGDLDGAIIDVYNSDMDLDGNPEILIQAKGKDTIKYTNMYAFEFSNGKAQKLDFPKLTKSQKQGYRGDDNFYIREGILMREFPVYDGNGKDAKPTGQKRQLQYGLRNNNFTVKQLSKESTSEGTSKAGLNQPAKHAANENKHPVEKKKKKKHKRHHSDE